MPRETIGNSDQAVVKVGWGRKDDVQIGVELVDGRILFIGADEVGSLDRAEETPTPSLWCNLNRGDVNHLIRILRRARDQAFGKDE